MTATPTPKPGQDVPFLPSLIVLLNAGVIIGLAISCGIPLIALQLEAVGFSASVIGMNSALGPLGVLLISPFVPALTERFGAITMLLGGLVLMGASFISFAFVPAGYAWFPIRFLAGLGMAFAWIVSEAWLNAIVPDNRRGRIMALYGFAIGLGFVAGPLIPKFAGTDGPLAFLIAGGLILVNVLPGFFIRGARPVISSKEKPQFRILVKMAPMVFAAALLAGLLDSVALTFLPLYSIRQGLTADDALLVTILFLAGGLLFQLPMGWLADKVDRTKLLLGIGVICVIGPLCLMYVFDEALPRTVMLLLWGGFVGPIYVLGVTLLGTRFKAKDLTAANAAFVMSFQIANIIGPPTSGAAMEAFGPDGLLWFLSASTGIFVVIGLARRMIRR